MATPYKNLGGNSGVVAYDIYDKGIVVQFRSGKHTVYLYTEASVGSVNLLMMKMLAERGRGLNGFINRHVKYDYSQRL